ncbi:MAG: DUF2842 domain-containing protein [Pseudomonadota bacterium]
MSYRTRKLLCALFLFFGLPLYIFAAVTLVGLFERPHLALEFAIYVGLGVLWALPLRALFRGIGRPDPDNPDPGGTKRHPAGK